MFGRKYEITQICYYIFLTAVPQMIVHRKTWLRKKKLFIIDLIVNIIHILKRRCTTYLLLLQIYKEVFSKRSPLNLLNKILAKYLRKTSFLVRLQILKMIYSHLFFQAFAKSLIKGSSIKYVGGRAGGFLWGP